MYILIQLYCHCAEYKDRDNEMWLRSKQECIRAVKVQFEHDCHLVQYIYTHTHTDIHKHTHTKPLPRIVNNPLFLIRLKITKLVLLQNNEIPPNSWLIV